MLSGRKIGVFIEVVRAYDAWAVRPAVVALSVAGVVVAAGCGDELNTPVVADALTELEADGVFYEMDVFMERQGIRSGRIFADSAYTFYDSSVVHLWRMEMILS